MNEEFESKLAIHNLGNKLFDQQRGISHVRETRFKEADGRAES